MWSSENGGVVCMVRRLGGVSLSMVIKKKVRGLYVMEVGISMRSFVVVTRSFLCSMGWLLLILRMRCCWKVSLYCSYIGVH